MDDALPSVDPLSTTVIDDPLTLSSCALTASRQSSVCWRPFQLTMMISTAAPLRTFLQCGA
jgi:hypothetical protein